MDRQHREYQSDSEEIEMLIERTKHGDKEAFASIIRNFEKPMYIYCYHMLKSKEEAEDARQEIFIRVYEQIHKYRPNMSFSAWLYKIAYNYSLNQIRSKKRWFRFIDRYKYDQPETSTQQIDSQTTLKDFLNLLTIEERHILVLRAIHQYHFDEISEMLNMKPATVRKKYERLRKKLQTKEVNEGGRANASITKSI
ncbi:sigma-70 family RNA polymerase sigma factor [Paenibacillus sp. alder61]|uniref:Sigma-70 family RNA polymerase sigma factor n=1 Tax=Paenibacillus faecis TaxID=862114 RepID=A0A5D0CU75_9BACL|nr:MULTISPECIES: sigma-70 family RNA polymerase sigma factor [Paenibacillus]MCA1293281.1 sigma-70 family RNA polymerase sigma factor [Paenibacillus sp. alder61]TYA12347.1 sigma-70 family RNA polymerase sigma factor [Paenibacillus faecis]